MGGSGGEVMSVTCTCHGVFWVKVRVIVINQPIDRSVGDFTDPLPVRCLCGQHCNQLDGDNG